MQTQMKRIPTFQFKPKPEPQIQPQFKTDKAPSGYALIAVLAHDLCKLDTAETREHIAALTLLFFGDALPSRSVLAFSNFARDVKGHRFTYTPRLFSCMATLLDGDKGERCIFTRERFLLGFETAERDLSEFGIPNSLRSRLDSLLAKLGGAL